MQDSDMSSKLTALFARCLAILGVAACTDVAPDPGATTDAVDTTSDTSEIDTTNEVGTSQDGGTHDSVMIADTLPSDTGAEDSLIVAETVPSDTEAQDSLIVAETTPSDTGAGDSGTCAGGAPCAVAHGSGSCDNGMCSIMSCDLGYDDCDENPVNGCETSLATLDACGACGAKCDPVYASAACGNRVCTILGCDPGRDDCDDSVATGCETDLRTLAHCGSCGVPCQPENAVANCTTGNCTIAECNDGYGDCDGLVSNGCERRLNTLADCGACAAQCSHENAVSSCTSGTCSMLSCDSGFRDCDALATNGCEADLASPAHCGACNNACDAGSTCADGACRLIAATGISVGYDSACAVLDDRTVACWGENSYGQLGNATTTNSTVPVRVSGLADAAQISVGYSYACAVRVNGQVMCWGRNIQGSLGNGLTSGSATTPGLVVGLSDATQVATSRGSFCCESAAHTCALRANRRVVCWGANDDGQLGNGTITDSKTPVEVSGLSDAVHVDVGEDFSCALRANGGVVCWGNGDSYKLGVGTTDSSIPIEVTNVVGATQVALGNGHACATLSNGQVMCWGNGSGGGLGNGTSTSSTAVAVTQLAGVAATSAGTYNTCAVKSNGHVACWGHNYVGQLAADLTADDTYTPTAEGYDWGGSVIADATRIAVGDEGTCVIRAAGEVWCAGDGMKLGDGQLASSPTARWRFYPVRYRARPLEDSACSDGRDNDSDGNIDCADSNCFVTAGSSLGAGAIVGVEDGKSMANYGSTCNGKGLGRERRHLWRAPSAGRYEFVGNSPASKLVLAIESFGCGTQIGCDAPTTGSPRVVVELQANQEVGVVVDRQSGECRAFEVCAYDVTINRL